MANAAAEIRLEKYFSREYLDSITEKRNSLLRNIVTSILQNSPIESFCWSCEEGEQLHASVDKRNHDKIKRCAKCNIASYGSPSCQREDWGQVHRRECLFLQRISPLKTLSKCGRQALKNAEKNAPDIIPPEHVEGIKEDYAIAHEFLVKELDDEIPREVLLKELFQDGKKSHTINFNSVRRDLEKHKKLALSLIHLLQKFLYPDEFESIRDDSFFQTFISILDKSIASIELIEKSEISAECLKTFNTNIAVVEQGRKNFARSYINYMKNIISILKNCIIRCEANAEINKKMIQHIRDTLIPDLIKKINITKTMLASIEKLKFFDQRE